MNDLNAQEWKELEDNSSKMIPGKRKDNKRNKTHLHF